MQIPGWEDPCDFCSSDTEKLSKADWVACDICKRWCHDACVGISGDPNSEFSSWHCPICEEEHGPSVPRRASSRKRAAIDYAALDRGEPLKTLHAFISKFEDFSNYETLPASPIPTEQSIRSGGLERPVIIRSDKFSQLGMRVPDNLTVDRVVDLVGEETPVEVVDVQTQNNLVGWDLGTWGDYFQSEKRDRIRNVISLEISDSPLGAGIIRPQVVRDVDLVDQVWPWRAREEQEQEPKPKVKLYCLMSVKGSYTDFHIDFAGSSVFYHVCSGSKTFLFVPPTDTNLSKYKKWCSSINQSETFFGDLVKECYRADLEEGDSLIIPSGWIHAVHTPRDSVVIGGNFLAAYSLETHIKLVTVEKKMKVPPKFQFPKFDKLIRYTAQYYLSLDDGNGDEEKPTKLELAGLEALRDYVSDNSLARELDEKLQNWGCSGKMALRDEKSELKVGGKAQEMGTVTPKVEKQYTDNEKEELSLGITKTGKGEAGEDKENDINGPNKRAKH